MQKVVLAEHGYISKPQKFSRVSLAWKTVPMRRPKQRIYVSADNVYCNFVTKEILIHEPKANNIGLKLGGRWSLIEGKRNNGVQSR